MGAVSLAEGKDEQATERYVIRTMAPLELGASIPSTRHTATAPSLRNPH